MRESKYFFIFLITVISLNANEFIKNDDKKILWEAVSEHQIIVLADSCSSKVDTIVKGMNIDSLLGLNKKDAKLDTFINVTFCIEKVIAGKFMNSTFTYKFMKCKNMHWPEYWIFDPINLTYKGCINDSEYIAANDMDVEHAISLLGMYIKGTLPQNLSKPDAKFMNYVKTLSSDTK